MTRTKYPGIYQRGDKYVAVMTYRDGGKRRQKWITRDTLRAVQSARRDFLNGLDRGLKPSGGKMTLEAFMRDVWLPEIAATRRPATVASYAKYAKNHIIPGLGDVKLKDLDRERLKAFYRSRPTPATARYCHSVMSSCLAYAVESDVLAANPCRSVRAPKSERTETRFLELDEARRMLSEATGERLEGAITLGLVGGLRLAEVCGLVWRDVNLSTALLNVRGSFYGPTKSGKARTFTLPGSAVAALRRYRANQAQDLLRFGIRQEDGTPVMATWDGRAMNPDTLAATFRAFCAEHRFDCSFHGLRHTCASLLLSSGTDVRTVAERLGHSPRVLLATYARFMTAADRMAADRLGAMLGG